MILNIKQPAILRQFSNKTNPFKRSRKTSSPFQVSFKILKVATNGLNCNIVLKHKHNHFINSLEALSFEMPSEEVRKEVNSLFWNNLNTFASIQRILPNLKKDW